MKTNLGLFLAKRAQLSPRMEALVEVGRALRVEATVPGGR